MRKLKGLWRSPRAARVCEELESWTVILLSIGAALLLYATLKAQAAHAAEFPSEVGAPTLLFQAPGGSFTAAAPLETDLRVSVAGRCHVTRDAIERVLGRSFQIPADLEPLMPSFKGRIVIRDDGVEWSVGKES